MPVCYYASVLAPDAAASLTNPALSLFPSPSRPGGPMRGGGYTQRSVGPYGNNMAKGGGGGGSKSLDPELLRIASNLLGQFGTSL